MEKLFWSIGLPGFGQILNRKYIKGIGLILLEFLINIQANFNQVILLSFHGKVDEAIQQTNYGWLMFYPCLYFFAMWDAYRDAGGGQQPYSFLPFVFSAYSVTVGLIYSMTFTLFGVLLGPVWLPMLFVIPGCISGFLMKFFLLRYFH
ncbi:hypothetical protein [Halobacillus naozhouensis]|uniref:Uncharacterized protein n=1 Tax=Halobacillus naozhouensis TaxID=554880 RepID=A0ABY8J3T1_9BACI|nr:hypothetical protein [Halobacillus naozhouensis]WFT76257.1 hypothetical protein P9989_07805 [Halobacillus naozhouensis]